MDNQLCMASEFFKILGITGHKKPILGFLFIFNQS